MPCAFWNLVSAANTKPPDRDVDTPSRAAASQIRTLAPVLLASIAAANPAPPPPTTMTSKSWCSTKYLPHPITSAALGTTLNSVRLDVGCGHVQGVGWMPSQGVISLPH